MPYTEHMFGNMDNDLDPELRNLAALLSAFGGFEIRTVADRKRVQKLVYLAQQLNIPMGYSFGWYIHGPYSSSLARDYFRLESRRASGEELLQYKLDGRYNGSSKTLHEILSVKPDPLSDPDWAELLASIVFLKKESGLSTDEVRSTINNKKRHVSRYFDVAYRSLAEKQIIGA